MRVCVIGAGAAGLAAAKQALAHDIECVVYEQAGQVGGTWVYDGRTGTNEYGLPIHTSMYKNLRTNLPKEVMGYPDFPISEDEKSYISQQQILNFLESYTDHFNVRPHIKFYHHVKYIEPLDDKKWRITVRNLKTKTECSVIFDGVMVCNGHYHTPNVPDMNGRSVFRGLQIHSHDYRDPGEFKDMTVLVVGAGPSGMDIALQVASSATHVIMSHHSRDEISTVFPENLSQKPDVDRLEENKAVFKDKSEANVDVVIYCTGFLYSFPFLSEKCEVKVINNHVRPLYKHLMHISHPSMCFIGLPFYVCAFSMFDLQARFYFAYLCNKFELPTKKEMLDDMQKDTEELYRSGLSNKHAHMMGPKQGHYYLQLSNAAGIEPIPPVMTKLHNESSRRFNEDLLHFRDDVYTILNNEDFLQIQ